MLLFTSALLLSLSTIVDSVPIRLTTPLVAALAAIGTTTTAFQRPLPGLSNPSTTGSTSLFPLRANTALQSTPNNVPEESSPTDSKFAWENAPSPSRAEVQYYENDDRITRLAKWYYSYRELLNLPVTINGEQKILLVCTHTCHALLYNIERVFAV